MDEQIQGLRDAAVGLRREWEQPDRETGWPDVAVWFGSLLMLGPSRLRGFGAFCSVTLISRTWAAAHRRHTRAVNDVLGRAVELVAEDLEDRAAVQDAVDELAETVGGCRDSIGEIGESVTGLEAQRPYLEDFAARLTRHLEWHVSRDGEATPFDDLVRTKDDIREYLDHAIVTWRGHRDAAERSMTNIRGTGGDEGAWLERKADHDQAVHYIDAFQSARASLLGDTLPEVDGQAGAVNETPFDGPGQRQFPYAEGDVLVLGPECFIGDGVISYQGENYYPRPEGVSFAVSGDLPEPSVLLTLGEALTLRNFVHGDHFDTAEVDSAIRKIDATVERTRSEADDDDLAVDAAERADIERGEPEHDAATFPGKGAASVEQARADLCAKCAESGWAIVASVDSATEWAMDNPAPQVEVIAVHTSTPSRVVDNMGDLDAAVTAAIAESGNDTAGLRIYPGTPLRPGPQSDEERGGPSA